MDEKKKSRKIGGHKKEEGEGKEGKEESKLRQENAKTHQR